MACECTASPLVYVWLMQVLIAFFGDLCMTPFTWLRLAIIIIVLSYQVLLFSQHLWHHATHNMHHRTLLVIALWLLL